MKSQIALDGLDQKEGGKLAKWEFTFRKINKLIKLFNIQRYKKKKSRERDKEE
jgi:hypothetical protein